MKGDFSKGRFKGNNNFNGVLQQQGRVMLDADWNEQTYITNQWQDSAAQDTFGPGVAAVPADTPDAFKVTKVEEVDDEVKITVSPGRIWADGVMVNLEQETTFTASYLDQLTIVSPNSTRIAVILKIWREAINGFQYPELLIEPALGGPDTTERIQTSLAVKLLPLESNEGCENIRGKLQSGERGKLSVSLQPAGESDEPCPIAERGGYTGFEHHLYRIEIAKVNDERPAMFKWSRLNGGLVGRGDCNSVDTDKTITITANKQAITSSGLDEFYLEVVKFDEVKGHWHVTYGATVIRNGDVLTVNAEFYSEDGEFPPDNVFFRLWDRIEETSDFSNSEPHVLRDGIRLQLSDSGTFLPGDYWTFPVRAGEILNKQELLKNEPPEGIQYHRVPLAIIHLNADQNFRIEDCRRLFRPLTNQKVCCSYTVGKDGDYKTIQEAIDKLKWWGGEICLLPGIHRANVQLNDEFNIRIKGCGLRTLLLPEDKEYDKAVFHIENSSHIVIENMAFFCMTGIKVVKSHATEIGNNHLIVFKQALRAEFGTRLNFHHNKVWMFDKEGEVAVFSTADNCVIERNDIIVIPAKITSDAAIDEDIIDAGGDCIPFESTIYNATSHVERIVSEVPSRWNWALVDTFKTTGGIQIGSGSEQVIVRENSIRGGSGNGITLGSDLDLDELDIVFEDGTRVPDIILESPLAIFVTVMLGSELLSESVTLQFVNINNGSPYDLISNYSETDQITLDKGKYYVRVLDSDYQVDKVIPDSGSLDEFLIPQRYIVNVSRVHASMHLGELLAFIKDISIVNNRIQNMGLSGIGTPQSNAVKIAVLLNSNPSGLEKHSFIEYLYKQFAVVSGWVVDLVITENHISNCLERTDNPITLLTKIRGEGGISLGMCENLAIRENRIEENGLNHTLPVCGIYVSYAAQANISDNQITDNGQLVPENSSSGIRGGVVIRLAMPLTLARAIETSYPLAALGSYAARIHDNVIIQPVGRALTMRHIGAVSVMANRFQVNLSDKSNKTSGLLQTLDQFAGTVLIWELGQSQAIQSKATFASDSIQPVSTFIGPMVFADNQTRLWMNRTNFSSSIAIVTLNDLAFDNNQSEVMLDSNLTINTWLRANTLRAGYNRFVEPDKNYRLSLLTMGSLMNNTSNNQGDHCIISAIQGNDEKMIYTGNVTLSSNCLDVAKALKNNTYFNDWSFLPKELTDG